MKRKAVGHRRGLRKEPLNLNDGVKITAEGQWKGRHGYVSAIVPIWGHYGAYRVKFPGSEFSEVFFRQELKKLEVQSGITKEAGVQNL